MENRLIKPFVPDTIKRLDYLIGFLKKDREDREAHPLLRTSPYYKWLAYSIIRRELFEKVRHWMDKKTDPNGLLVDRLYDDLVEVWQELKEYGLEGPVRDGLMHEVLYWLATLQELRQSDTIFFIAPVHEGIPGLRLSRKEEIEELRFRGDFCIFGRNEDKGFAAVVDVKSEYARAMLDQKLIKTASQFGALGLQFFVASPVFDVDKGTDKDFHFMKKIRYLLDLRKSWTHRLLMLGKPITGPYPEGIVPPWLRSC